ncbi:MAG: hypothetical protein IKM20_09600 [Erysipelotrichales bacterium]|nr:hypothetical protein [Erysipelotrichales bacterium]
MSNEKEIKKNSEVKNDNKIDLSQIYGDASKRLDGLEPEEVAKIIKQMLRGRV